MRHPFSRIKRGFSGSEAISGGPPLPDYDNEQPNQHHQQKETNPLGHYYSELPCADEERHSVQKPEHCTFVCRFDSHLTEHGVDVLLRDAGFIDVAKLRFATNLCAVRSIPGDNEQTTERKLRAIHGLIWIELEKLERLGPRR
jgi:hypothetical protein